MGAAQHVRRTFALVIPYCAEGRSRELRVDVEGHDPLEAAACAWRSAEAVGPLLGGALDERGPILLIAPLPNAA